jgi:4-amino-4-deoxy-L-arabinose transferase-like glycosyltransferase
VADAVGTGPERGRAFRWWTLGACGVGLVVRLTYALVVRGDAPLQGDAVYYHGQAKLNLEGSWFVNPLIFTVKHHPAALVPSAQHPPLFTIVLTLGDLLGLRSVHAQLVLVCLLGTATVALVALVARDLAGPRAGSIAAVVAALYPGMWIFDGEVMSEALVVLLAAATVLAAVRCFRDCTTWRVVLLGLLTGLCALTRAELVLLVPFVALPTVLWQRSMDVRRRLALSGLAVVVALVPMAPWFAYNAARFHHSVTLSDQLQVTLAASNNASTYSGPLTASWCFTCVQGVQFPRTWDESDQGVYWQSQAVHYIEAHKARALEVAFERVGLEWNLYAPIRQAGHDFLEGWPVPVSDAWLVWYYPLTAAALVGAVILRRRRRPIYPLVAMYAVVTIVAFVTYGNYRFRAEAEAATVVLAAVAFDALWSAVAGHPARPRAHRRSPAPASDPAPVLPAREEVAV